MDVEYSIPALIAKKRDKLQYSKEEIEHIVQEITQDSIQGEQLGEMTGCIKVCIYIGYSDVLRH